MSRMKAHWPERLNPQMELKAAIYWLKARWHKADLIELVGICEAISLIEWCIDAVNREHQLRSEKLREEYRKQRESEFNKNPFDEV